MLGYIQGRNSHGQVHRDTDVIGMLYGCFAYKCVVHMKSNVHPHSTEDH